MRKPTPLVLSLLALFLVFGAMLLLWFASTGSPASKSTAWSIQPDQFPLGTVLQGSQVEMSLGLFSEHRPAPLPAFIRQLPPPLRKVSERVVEGFRSMAAKLGLRVRIEAPPFVIVTHKTVVLHVSRGPLALISLRLKTDTPAELRGNLVVRLSGGAYGVTNIVVPLSAKVISGTASKSRAVLIAASPYQEYSTGNGRNFEPLAAINTHLAEQGIRVDFCQTLPNSLSPYRTILLGHNEMAGLGAIQAEKLRKFVAGGGRLILAADAFFVPTVPSANRLLTSFGLQIENKDAGMSVTNFARTSRRPHFGRDARGFLSSGAN